MQIILIGTTIELTAAFQRAFRGSNYLVQHFDSVCDALSVVINCIMLIIIDSLRVLPTSAEQEFLILARQTAPIISIIGMHDEITSMLGLGWSDVCLPDELTAEGVISQANVLLQRKTVYDHREYYKNANRYLIHGSLTIDPLRRCVCIDGQDIKLTRTEFDLLYFLARNEGIVMTEDQIYDRVWKCDNDFSNGLATMINRLRKKVEPDPSCPALIENVRGVGYRFMSKKDEKSKSFVN